VRPISVALHAETINSTNNAVVEQTVIDPKGFIVNKNELGEDGKSDIFTSFKPEIDGIYTLFLRNLGTDQAQIGGIFGYLPVTENSGEINMSTVTGLLAGAWVFVIGIGTLDGRGDRKRQSLGLTR
jgi:hypothetical protein